MNTSYKHNITLLFLILASLPAFSQFRMIGTASWTAVTDSTYSGTINFQVDLTGKGYLATSVVDTFRVFTGTEQIYTITSVGTKTFSSAQVTIKEYNGDHGIPIGQVMVYDPAGKTTLPQAPFGSTGSTAQLQAAVDTYNARLLSSAGVDLTPYSTSLQMRQEISDSIATVTGLADGDKGDITVSGSGATWTIDANAVDADNIATNAVGADEIAPSGVAAASYTAPNITVDQDGRITSATSNTTLVNRAELGDSTAAIRGDMLTGNEAITISGDVTGSGTTAITTTIAAGVVGPTELENTAVTPGAYTNANITVDADGRVTAASSGGGTNFTVYDGTTSEDAVDGDSLVFIWDEGITGAVGPKSGGQIDINVKFDGGEAAAETTPGNNNSFLMDDASQNRLEGITWPNLVSSMRDSLGSGISDGDKGDITVSGSGAVWSIDAETIDSTEIISPLTLAHTSTTLSEAPLTLIRRYPDNTASNKIATLVLRNDSDIAGGSDYQNEVNLVMRAGTTTDHRRYFDFQNYAGTTKWLNGVNAGNAYILYDSEDQTHRMWFYSGGRTDIMSAGTGAVWINRTPGTDTSGTGGFRVGNGGTDPDDLMILEGTTGRFAFGKNTAVLPRYTFHVQDTFSYTDSGSFGGATIAPIAELSSAAIGGLIGLRVRPKVRGNAVDFEYAIEATSEHSNTATIGTSIGLVSDVNLTSTGTVTTAKALEARLTAGSGTISTGYGLEVPVHTGTIGTWYGIRVFEPSTSGGFRGALRMGVSAGANKYNIYADGTADNYFNGEVGIKDATPDADLDVAGTMRLDGTFGDKDGDVGTAGQVLESTASGTNWVTRDWILNTTQVTTTSSTAISAHNVYFITSDANIITWTMTLSGLSAGDRWRVSCEKGSNALTIATTGSEEFYSADPAVRSSTLSITENTVLYFTYDGTHVFYESTSAGQGPRTVEANTAGSGTPNALTYSETNKVLTNEGATAQNYHTLPTAASGLTFTFVVQDSDGIRVVANTGDTIRVAGTVSASAGYTESTTVGDVITLVAINATEWIAISYVGTWTTI